MKNAPPERILFYCDPRNWQCPFRSIGILNYFSKLVFELESFVSLLELKQIQVLGLLLTLRPILLKSQFKLLMFIGIKL